MNLHPLPAGPHVNAAGVKFWLPYKPPPQSLVTPLSRNPLVTPRLQRASIPGRSRLGLNSRQVQTGPQFPAVLGSHALLRPATCGSHALLRPATWGSHALLRPATWGSRALLPSSAPPPGVHMPSCAPPPGVHIALLDRTTTQTTPQSAHKPFTNPTSA